MTGVMGGANATQKLTWGFSEIFRSPPLEVILVDASDHVSDFGSDVLILTLIFSIF